MNNNPFDFTRDAKKLELLEKANNNMHITNT
jgi:hypothetical protein